MTPRQEEFASMKVPPAHVFNISLQTHAALLRRESQGSGKVRSEFLHSSQEFAQWIASAKRPEPRESRLKRTIEMLAQKTASLSSLQ